MTEKFILDEKKKKKPYSSMTITTGDPELNIKHFNKMMGTSGYLNGTINPGVNEKEINKAVEATCKDLGTIAAVSPDGASSVTLNSSDSVAGAADNATTGEGGGGIGESLMIKEATHATKAKPAGNRIAAFNKALTKAKELKADVVYGYETKKSPGKFIEIEPVEYDHNDAAFRKRYGAYLIYVAYPDKDFIEESLSDQTASNLTEAKRYVRRYYIRPQNIFCSNKAEILKTLIDIDKANCTVYTLNNLGDTKDVTKLTNNDIIYYYDNEILYDKNHVKVMDYDLYIKHEENRDRIKPGQVPNAKFNDVYDDRMTQNTVVEDLANEFSLDFDDVNAYGEFLKENKVINDLCCICGEPIEGYGNNPEPYKHEGRCCDACNLKFVIPARIAQRNLGEKE